MKTNGKLALSLGLAAGAVVAVLLSGRKSIKNTTQTASLKHPGIRLNTEIYDDSEVCYI